MKTAYIVLLLIISASGASGADYKEMSYRDFLDHLRAGTVSTVTFHDDGLFVGFTGETWTNTFLVRGTLHRYHSDPLLWDELKSAGITPTTKKRDTPPWGILIMTLLPLFLWPIIALAMLIAIILLHRKLNKVIKLLNANANIANKTIDA